MSGYKYIETTVARFIASRYRFVVEAGAGTNIHAAELIQRAGVHITCIDLFIPDGIFPVSYVMCDVNNPDYSLFTGVECIYAIRPGEEMICPLIHIAQRINADFLVYHLGFEGYKHPGKIIEKDVGLRQYVTRQN
jgi:uncharacterized UPF0146 family protein